MPTFEHFSIQFIDRNGWLECVAHTIFIHKKFLSLSLSSSPRIACIVFVFVVCGLAILIEWTIFIWFKTKTVAWTFVIQFQFTDFIHDFWIIFVALHFYFEDKIELCFVCLGHFQCHRIIKWMKKKTKKIGMNFRLHMHRDSRRLIRRCRCECVKCVS